MKDDLLNSAIALEAVLEVSKDVPMPKPADSKLNEHVKRGKLPRRILHFSDGTLEEYSTDEEDDVPDSKADNQISHVDPKQMTWFPWMWYQAATTASQTLQVCDYLGESLASFFGITTPKYQYEIDEYNSIIAEEKEAQRKMDMEMGGWMHSNEGELNPINKQPKLSQPRY